MIPTRKIPRYGWKPDLPDHRDYIYNLRNYIKMAHEVPLSMDLSAQMPPVYDQGQVGSCTGNGWAALLEYRSIQQGEPTETPSRLFIYYNERVIEGSAGQDAGAEIRDGAKTVSAQGAPPETLWPYNESQVLVQPNEAAYQEAVRHEALQYQRIVVGPGAPMRTAISEGLPIVFGMPVPDYFEQGWNPLTDPLPLPGPNVNYIGGHCMVVVGYDFTRSRFPEPVFKVRNSWGNSWGEGGYFWIHYEWFTTLATDLWVVQKVS